MNLTSGPFSERANGESNRKLAEGFRPEGDAPYFFSKNEHFFLFKSKALVLPSETSLHESDGKHQYSSSSGDTRAWLEQVVYY